MINIAMSMDINVFVCLFRLIHVYFFHTASQLGQSYQDYNCPAGEAHMQCPVKKDMTITATTNAKWCVNFELHFITVCVY